MLKMWEGHTRKNVVFSMYQALFPTGAVVGPMIISLFVVDIPQDIDTFHTQPPNQVGNQTLLGHNDTGGVSYSNAKIIDYLTNETLTLLNFDSEISSDDVGLIRYSYVIIGVFSLVISLLFGFAYCMMMPLSYNTHHARASTKRSNTDSTATEKSSNKLLLLVISLASFSMAFFILQSWITPFVLEYINWNAKVGQYMASAFWCGMVAGRIVGVVLLVWISPAVLLVLHLVCTLMNLTLTYVAAMWYANLLWVCVPLVGFSCKSHEIYLNLHKWL